MKKFFAVLAMTLVSIAALADQPLKVTVEAESISVNVGTKEFVADLDFQNLKMVRIWKSPDFLICDIDEKGADFSRCSDPAVRPLSQDQAKKTWVQLQKEFAELRKKLNVEILTVPKRANSKWAGAK